MKAIKDYHDMYLDCDVLLLPDVFKKFRNVSLKKSWVMSQSLCECTSFKLGCSA